MAQEAATTMEAITTTMAIATETATINQVWPKDYLSQKTIPIENKAKSPYKAKSPPKNKAKTPPKNKAKTEAKRSLTQTHSHNTITQKIGRSTYSIGEVNLTQTQIQILDQGLGFVPNIAKTNIEEEREEIENKLNSLIDKTLKEYMGVERAHKESYKLAKNIAKEAETKLRALEEIETPNLTLKEEEALKKLMKDRSIVIKPIDKNLGTACINKELYIKEVEKLLGDPNSYKELTKDPTVATLNKLNMLIESLHKEKKLSQRIAQRILPDKQAVPGKFYALPKIHKPKLGWRPIVANNQHPTENLSKWISSVLKPTSERTQTYVSNSYSVADEISLIDKAQKEKSDWIIITADVENLYGNIPHREGAANCIEMIYADRNNKLKPKDRNAMQALIHNTLCNNVFEFNTKYYTQINGTAMGTSMAPAYANLYLAKKEEEWLKSTTKKPYILLFKRYLDDILILLNNSNGILTEMLEELKELYKPLKLTIEHGKSLPFLDLVIELEGDNLGYKLYRKPLNARELLPRNSCHPNQCKEGTIIGEYKRIEKLNSTALNKRKEEIKLMQRCMRKKYSWKEVKRLKRKAKREKGAREEGEKRVYMTLTYNPNTEVVSRHVAQRVKEAKKEQREREEREIPEVKLLTCFRTQPNLKKLLTRARVASNPAPNPLVLCHQKHQTASHKVLQLQNQQSSDQDDIQLEGGELEVIQAQPSSHNAAILRAHNNVPTHAHSLTHTHIHTL